MRLAIVGGSDAGISAALRAKELAPATDVTVVVADRYPNYSICGLPFYISGETADWRDLAHRKTPEIEAKGIRLLLDHVAEGVDAPGHVLQVRGPGGAFPLPYDRLVIGTGAVPVVPPLEGIDLPGVHVLHTMDHSFAVHDRVLQDHVRAAVVIGAGYIGTEMADALTHRGLQVTLVEQVDTVLTTVDHELGADLAGELRRHGVDVATGVSIEGIEPDSDRLRVSGSGGFARTADLVLVAVGVKPDTTLAESAGVRLGVRGAVAVDRGMHTGVPDVFAAGDCVETWHRLLGQPAYLPLGTTAHKQGRVAGENALGGERVFAGSLGTQVVKVFDLVAARTGLREGEAREAGFDPVTVEGVYDDHKAYYPGARPVRIRVTGDRGSGLLLGAQLLGHPGTQVAKRVDIVAAAIHHRMTVEDLHDLDLSYTPPLSSPWDPVQMAASDWGRRVRPGAALPVS